MKSLIIALLNKAIEEKKEKEYMYIMESLGNSNYVIIYNEKGRVVNIKKAYIVF